MPILNNTVTFSLLTLAVLSLTASVSSATVPQSGHSETTDSDIIASSSPTSIPLYLPVTPSDPDILGIAHITAFYGLGPWTAWFLTIIASWWRMTADEKYEPNTLLYILGTNLAALDVLYGIYLVKRIPEDLASYEADLNSKMGSLGAAFNVAYWGTFHAVWQAAGAATGISYSTDTRSHRIRALSIGLVLPCLSLLSSLCLLSSDIVGNLPAIYWNGVEKQFHELLFLIAASTPILIVPFGVCSIYASDQSLLPHAIIRLMDLVMVPPVKRLAKNSPMAPWLLGLIALVILSFVSLRDNILRFCVPLFLISWFFVEGFILWLTFSLVIGWVSCMCFVIFYVPVFYLFHAVNVRESCVFMPCSQESGIKNQIYAVFSGFFAFDIWEGLLLAWRRYAREGGCHPEIREGE